MVTQQSPVPASKYFEQVAMFCMKSFCLLSVTEFVGPLM